MVSLTNFHDRRMQYWEINENIPIYINIIGVPKLLEGNVCGYWVCAIFETPIFSPKIPLKSISFSQITEIPLRSITILEFLPLPRPSFSKSSSRFFAARGHGGRFTAASPSAKRSVSTPGLSPARMQPDASYNDFTISSRNHQFDARSHSRNPHVYDRAALEPHMFHFIVAHTYQHVGRVPPPPPLGKTLYFKNSHNRPIVVMGLALLFIV